MIKKQKYVNIKYFIIEINLMEYFINNINYLVWKKCDFIFTKNVLRYEKKELS